MAPAPFEQLDFVYTPSADVAADIERFTSTLGATVEFAIERFGTRVAMVRLTEGPPHLVLAEHLGGREEHSAACRPALVGELGGSRHQAAAPG